MEKILGKSLMPQIFAMSAGTLFSKTDRYHLGCVKRSRQVLLCSEEAALGWLKSQSPGARLGDVPAALKEVSGSRLFSGTVGEGDVLTVPPGWVSVERALSKNLVGLQQRFLTAKCQPVIRLLLTEMGPKLPSKHVLRAASAAACPERSESGMHEEGAMTEDERKEQEAKAKAKEEEEKELERLAKEEEKKERELHAEELSRMKEEEGKAQEAEEQGKAAGSDD